MDVLCYGATGIQGGPVALQLAARGHRVRALVRAANPNLTAAGIDTIVADYDDAPALAEASRGIDAVFLMLPLVYEGDKIFRYFSHVLEAATNARVGLFVFNPSTRVPARRTDVWGFELKRELERRLAESGLPYIIVRPTFYMENLLGPSTFDGLRDDNTLRYSLPSDRKASWICADDMAKFCVAAIERPQLAGSAIDVGGPDALDGNDLARHFSRMLGREISYEAIAPSEFERLLRQGLPVRAAEEVTRINAWWRANLDYEPGFVANLPDVQRLLPVPDLTGIDGWIARHRW